MTALLSFIAAMIGGSTDFGGGIAARSSSAIRVTAWVQSAGLVVLLVAVWFVDAEAVTRTDLVGGAAAGVAALISFVLFYAALNRGQMSLLTPIVAIVGAVTPVLVEISRGRSLASLQIVGMVLAMIAVTLVVQRSPELAVNDATPPLAIALAALSGFGFSFFFLALGETSSDAGLWPLVVTRSVSGLSALLLARVITGGVSMPDRKISRLVVCLASVTLLRCSSS